MNMQSNDHGLEKIKSKIIADAKKNASYIVNKAKKEVETINSSNKKEAEEHNKNMEKKIESDIALFINKTMAQARLKSKRLHLEKRETLMNGLIEEVLSGFDRKSTTYHNYLESLLVNNLGYLTDEVIVYCNKKDVSLVLPIVDKVKNNQEFSQIKNIEIKEDDISGGITLQDSNGKKINESIKSKFDRVKQEIRQEITKIVNEK